MLIFANFAASAAPTPFNEVTAMRSRSGCATTLASLLLSIMLLTGVTDGFAQGVNGLVAGKSGAPGQRLSAAGTPVREGPRYQDLRGWRRRRSRGIRPRGKSQHRRGHG